MPANPAYDRCTSNTYAAANTTANLIGLIAESETDTVACGGYQEGTPASTPASLNSLTAPSTVNRPDQVVADTRTFYDDPTFATTFPQPAAPTKGDVTMTRKAANWSSGAFSYQTASKASYDSYGRTTCQWDANGNQTTTGYTMNTVGLTTAVTTTNALLQSSTVTLDPQRGLTLTATDPNHAVSTIRFDPLGRTTLVWLHNRATTLAADLVFTYQLSSTGITAVTTDKINGAGGYVRSTLIYDAMLRQRQTQAPTPQAGRMVTDAFYDSRGWVSTTYNGWWDSATLPNTTLVSAANLVVSVPNADVLTYDGLGRVIRDDSLKNGLQVSTTTTVYNGDRTTTIPPQGGVTATTVSDPLGRTSELDQYTAAPTLHEPTDTFAGIRWVSGGITVATSYGYDSHGNQNTITDAQTHTWTSTYNLLGQVEGKTDPDAGTSTMAYDPNGNLTQISDSRGKTVSYTYDGLNRKTGLYDAPVNAQTVSNQLAAWVFDNANNAVANMTNPIGQLTTATAYHAGAAYTSQASGFNVFAEPLGETITIPSATEGAVLGTYSMAFYLVSLLAVLAADRRARWWRRADDRVVA